MTRLRRIDEAIADGKEVLIRLSLDIHNPHQVHRDSVIRHGLHRKESIASRQGGKARSISSVRYCVPTLSCNSH
jgi:hypothetical protein